MPRLEYTIQDYQIAHALGVALYDPEPEAAEPESVPAALFDSIAAAYQRIDAECARAHRQERAMRGQRDFARKWLARGVWLLAMVAGIAIGEAYMIWSIGR